MHQLWNEDPMALLGRIGELVPVQFLTIMYFLVWTLLTFSYKNTFLHCLFYASACYWIIAANSRKAGNKMNKTFWTEQADQK